MRRSYVAWRKTRRYLRVPAGESGPAEWAGLTPIVDWDAARSVLSGSDVTSVTDASPGGHNLTGVGTTKPQYTASDADFGGAPSWTFGDDGANGQRFTFTDLGIASHADILIAMVMVCGAGSGNRYALAMTSQDVAVFADATNSVWRGWIDILDGTNMCDSNDDPAAPSVGALGKVGTTASIYVNSTTADDTASTGSPVTYSGGVVGNFATPGAAFRFDGKIARILMLPAPTNAQRNTCITSLLTKYGLP